MVKKRTTSEQCPGCGRMTATSRTLPTYHYRESGLSNLWLRDGVIRTDCRRCGETFLAVLREFQLLQVIALELFMEPRHLKGEEMRFLRGACQISQAKLANALRKRRETVAERVSKQDPGINFAEEVALRVVLLGFFNAYQHGKGNSLLDAGHRKRLSEFTDWFVEFSTRFADHGVQRQKLVAALDKKGVSWHLDEAA